MKCLLKRFVLSISSANSAFRLSFAFTKLFDKSFSACSSFSSADMLLFNQRVVEQAHLGH